MSLRLHDIEITKGQCGECLKTENFSLCRPKLLDSGVWVCCHLSLLSFSAEVTIGACVLITGYLTVSALLFPAWFSAHNKLGTMHTGRTIVQLSTGVKPETVAYRW